jgi:CheY-like chemotaxis protein
METGFYSNYSILCVDDDPDDLQMLREAIAIVDGNCQVVEAHNGIEGLSQLEEMKSAGVFPSLIVLDINMPKMDGRQTFLSIRADESFSCIPIVIFSTSSSSLDRMFFTNKNVEYIIKPISFTQCIEAAAKLLQHCKRVS